MKRFTLTALFCCLPALPATQYYSAQAARAEIGQFFFNSDMGRPSDVVLAGPSGLAFDPTHNLLFVADGNVLGANDGFDQNGVQIQGNRVLAFDTTTIPGPYADLTAGSLGDTLCKLCGFNAIDVIGQADFRAYLPGVGQTPTVGGNGYLNSPTSVATDGVHLAVADTRNNRVLIWNSVPLGYNPSNGYSKPDVVLGQTSFTTGAGSSTVNPSTLHAPSGVWLHNGELFVADTLDNRILIWKTIPTSNNQPADIVLGASDFTTVSQPNPLNPVASATQFYNPVGVSTDGTHLFVADDGYNRVLIWNSIPTASDTPADVVIGQADMSGAIFDNATAVCASSKIGNGSPCAADLGAPRAVISDGSRLYVADTGNNRVLIWNTIPTTDGKPADEVLGQTNFTSNVTAAASSIFTTDTTNTYGGSNVLAAPTSLAWDGTNLYVGDLFNRRVMIFSPVDFNLDANSVVNAASQSFRQEGYVVISLPTNGKINAGDTVSITIAGATYTYTIVKSDTVDTITAALIKQINSANNNAGDNSAIAVAGPSTNIVYLTSRVENPGLNTIAFSATTSNTADILATASGAGYLTGGNGATVSPYSAILICSQSGGCNATGNPPPPLNGNLADGTVAAPGCGSSSTNVPTSTPTPLPTTLPSTCNGSTPQGSVQVIIDGVPAPLYVVSPSQVKAVVPYEFGNRSTSSLYVRTVHADGSVTITSPQALIVAPDNPGLFSVGGSKTPALQAMHQSGNPSVTLTLAVSTVQAGDSMTVTVNKTPHTYTVVSGDTLTTITNNLIQAINTDSAVSSTATGAPGIIVVSAKTGGTAGTGITVTAAVTAASGKTSAGVTLTANNGSTCCAANGTGLITNSNPAVPNELITLYGTGLGVVQGKNLEPVSVTDGVPFDGPINSAVSSAYANVGGTDSTVIEDGLAPGGVGVYAVQFQIPSTATTNQNTPVYIAQDQFISNIVNVPVAATAATGFTAFSAAVNPIYVSAGTTTGAAQISWSAKTSDTLQITSGSPTGTVVASGLAASGTVSNIPVTDNTTFYLIDTANGNVLSQFTQRVFQLVPVPTYFQQHACPATQPGTVWVANSTTSFSAQPGIVQVSPGETTGQVVLLWNVADTNVTSVAIYRNSNTTPGFTGGAQADTLTAPVTDGTVFWLEDYTGGTRGNDLGCLTVGVRPRPSDTGAAHPTAPSRVKSEKARVERDQQPRLEENPKLPRPE